MKWILLALFLVACDSKTSNQVAVDPGEAGKKTIEGIDRDADGVRDDLQVWIQAEFKDSREIQLAVREMAKVHPMSCELPLRTKCLEGLVGFDRALEIELQLMERYVNTPERQQHFEAQTVECETSLELQAAKCNFELGPEDANAN